MTLRARRCAMLVLALAAAAACAQAPPAPPESADQRAARLAQEMILVDTHIDVPDRLREKMEDISVATAKGDFDHPRARQGGLDVAFMSIYVPAKYQHEKDGGAKVVADQLIDMVEGFARDWPDKFALARSVEEARSAAAKGLVALPMGMENGAPVEGDLANLRHFHERGIRYITLTHSENNHICDSSYAKEKQWNGLSPFGREVVAEMNRLGIMVDISHVSDATFYQVMELSRAPAIASHSSCRRFTEGWERNMDDAMIELLGKKGGVIQINFGSGFIHPEAHKQTQTLWDELKAFNKGRGVAEDADDAPADDFRKSYWETHKKIFADVTDVADHIDHVVKLAGIDHVGIGSDYDGVGDSLPSGLKDVSQYPNLIRELLARGYSEQDVAKIMGGNLLRVWTAVERLSQEARNLNSEAAGAPTGS